MLSEAEELKLEEASLKRQIAVNDKAIREADERQAKRRAHGDNLHRRLAITQGRIARADAPMVKPTGPFVTEVAPNGTHWKV